MTGTHHNQVSSGLSPIRIKPCYDDGKAREIAAHTARSVSCGMIIKFNGEQKKQGMGNFSCFLMFVW